MAVTKENLVELIQLPSINIELDRQGILHITYVEGSIIDIEEKKEELEAVMKITKGEKHPVIFYFETMVTVTRAAKEYSVKAEREFPYLAVALLAEDFAHVIAVNLYLKLYNPSIETKVFKSDVKAEEWLLGIFRNAKSISITSNNSLRSL